MTAMLSVQGASKSFGGIRALNGCSFDVEDGSVTGLIGPNGSGKTTVFNVITGYEHADSGRVVMGGRAITRPDPCRATRSLPHVPLGPRPHLPAIAHFAPAECLRKRRRGPQPAVVPAVRS